MTVTLIGQSGTWTRLKIPLYLESVSAGFPSPAQDYVEQALDLNELCIKHPAATFFVRVQGESMTEAGIQPNDILVVDRSLRAQHGDIVIASVDGEFTVKELALRPQLQLLARNPQYPSIQLKDADALEVFGVVTNIVRDVRSRP